MSSRKKPLSGLLLISLLFPPLVPLLLCSTPFALADEPPSTAATNTQSNDGLLTLRSEIFLGIEQPRKLNSTLRSGVHKMKRVVSVTAALLVVV